jgi:hypothetical protein
MHLSLTTAIAAALRFLEGSGKLYYGCADSLDHNILGRRYLAQLAVCKLDVDDQIAFFISCFRASRRMDA